MRAIANESLYLAWGLGDPEWGQTPPLEPIGDTALVAEIGRRRAAFVGYCTPDPDGDIVTVTDGRFQSSNAPTKWLYFRFSFDFADGGDAIIREMAVFMHTEIAPDLPPGQMYFPPEDIADPGTMLLLERIAPVTLTASQRTIYETVFTL